MKEIHWPASVGNPGSSHAMSLGCTCSTVMNYYGRGDDSGLFKIAPGCPLHAIHPIPVDGIRCDRCGQVLEVLTRDHGGEERRSLACPNGCTPADRSDGAIEELEVRSGPPLAIAGEAAESNGGSPGRTCERCEKPIAPSGKRGRPRRWHEECLTPAELAVRARQLKARSRSANEGEPLRNP